MIGRMGSGGSPVVAAVLPAVALAGRAGAEVPSLTSARNAFIGHDVGEAARIYDAIRD